jgi:hypothetical protein
MKRVAVSGAWELEEGGEAVGEAEVGVEYGVRRCGA